jgi:membrane associated rhomboid family serine protease
LRESFGRSGRIWARRLLLQAGWKGDGDRQDRWNDPDPWDDSRFSPPGGFRLPLTYSGMILVICVLFFFVREFVPNFAFDYYLALNRAFVASRPWTLITHMFVHGNLSHLLVNMIVLFFFGTELERRVGESKFLQIFIISGLVAAIGQMAVLPAGYMMGASGALFGVMGCLAVIAPEITVLIYFVIPLSIRAAIVLFAVIDFALMGSADNIAHMAHITGLLAGLAYGGMLKDRYRRRYR